MTDPRDTLQPGELPLDVELVLLERIAQDEGVARTAFPAWLVTSGYARWLDAASDDLDMELTPAGSAAALAELRRRPRADA